MKIKPALLGATLLLASPVSAGLMCPGTPGMSETHQRYLEQRLLSLDRAARDAYQALPWETLRVANAQQMVGGQPDALFSWVRDETRWLPYAGELRGAEGVMQDRMGSSLDRALLLAALMEEAGHTVRLARTTLTEDGLDRLQSAWADMPVARRPDGLIEMDLSDASIAALAERLGSDPGAMAESLLAQREVAEERQSRLLGENLHQAEALKAMLGDILQAAGDGARPLEEPLVDHWWVQMRTADGWVDLDPALPQHSLGERLVVEGEVEPVYPEALPDEARHWLTIEVVAEQFHEGHLTEAVALSHRLSAAELLGQQMHLELYPVELPSPQELLDGSREIDTLPKALFGQQQWMPYLRMGDSLERHKLINADGSVEVPGQETATGAAFREATSVLGGIGQSERPQEEPASAELTAVMVRFHVEAPGRERESIERPLMDLLGPGRRAGDLAAFEVDENLRQQRAVELLSTLEVLGQVAWVPPAQLAAWHYEGLMENRQAGMAGAYLASHGDDSFVGKALESRSMRRHALDQLAAMRLAYSPYPERVALTRLNLLGYVELLEFKEGVYRRREGFDILDNRIDVPSGRAVAETRLAQGALDTLLEAEIAVDEKAVLGNAARAFQHSQKTGHAWQMVRRQEELEALGWLPDEDLQMHFKALLEQGQVLVMPALQSAGDEPVWWQLDPATGDLLGYGPDRRGQYVEAILVLISAGDNAMGAVGMVQSIWDCLFTASDPLCCTQDAAAKEMISRAVSSGLGGLAEAHDINIIIGRELISGGAFDRLNSAGISKAAGDVAGAGAEFIVDSWGRCP